MALHRHRNQFDSASLCVAMVSDVQAKQMGNLKPGELVRFPFRGVTPLALAVGCDGLQIPSGMVLVFLEEILGAVPASLQPATNLVFRPLADSDMMETALSYGDGHIVVVEPSARVATPFDPGFQSNGGLVIGKGLHTLRVRAGMQNWSHVEIMVDVNTWKAVQGANSIARKMAILDWQLHMLPDNRLDPQPTPFFSFRG